MTRHAPPDDTPHSAKAIAEAAGRRNIIRCLSCDDIIESRHRHDFRWCKCGSVAVDGGKDYRKRSWNPNGKRSGDHYEELSTGWGDDD